MTWAPATPRRFFERSRLSVQRVESEPGRLASWFPERSSRARLIIRGKGSGKGFSDATDPSWFLEHLSSLRAVSFPMSPGRAVRRFPLMSRTASSPQVATPPRERVSFSDHQGRKTRNVCSQISGMTESWLSLSWRDVSLTRTARLFGIVVISLWDKFREERFKSLVMDSGMDISLLWEKSRVVIAVSSQK